MVTSKYIGLMQIVTSTLHTALNFCSFSQLNQSKQTGTQSFITHASGILSTQVFSGRDKSLATWQTRGTFKNVIESNLLA